MRELSLRVRRRFGFRVVGTNKSNQGLGSVYHFTLLDGAGC